MMGGGPGKPCVHRKGGLPSCSSPEVLRLPELEAHCQHLPPHHWEPKQPVPGLPGNTLWLPFARAGATYVAQGTAYARQPQKCGEAERLGVGKLT